jgi:hypothetical protein
MEAPQPIDAMPAKKNRTPLIVAAVAIVVCCFCVAAAVAGYYGFITIRSTQTQVIPEEDFPAVATQELMTMPPASDPGEAPTGGLGNDILRNDAWQVVASAAVGRGCDQPLGKDSTIEVLQEPDASGVWVEKWTVACSSGDSYAFEVEFILDATGATFNVRWLP